MDDVRVGRVAEEAADDVTGLSAIDVSGTSI